MPRKQEREKKKKSPNLIKQKKKGKWIEIDGGKNSSCVKTNNRVETLANIIKRK